MRNIDAIRTADREELKRGIARLAATVAKDLVLEEYGDKLEVSRFTLNDIEQTVEKWLGIDAKEAEKADAEARAETVKDWIDDRVARGDIKEVVFYITVPENCSLRKNETIGKVEAMLDKYKISHGHVDTLPGSWNLNRDWVETGHFHAIVEFCGVYPVGWDMADVVELERMETSGEIIIMADWIVGGEHVPNN